MEEPRVPAIVSSFDRDNGSGGQEESEGNE